MGKIRGWMLKQKDLRCRRPNVVWENVGVPKYSKEQKKTIHVGYGTILILEKKGEYWHGIKRLEGGKRVKFGKAKNLRRLEDKARAYMQKHPYGESSRRK